MVVYKMGKIAMYLLCDCDSWKIQLMSKHDFIFPVYLLSALIFPLKGQRTKASLIVIRTRLLQKQVKKNIVAILNC